jgi:hypothetical protein
MKRSLPEDDTPSKTKTEGKTEQTPKTEPKPTRRNLRLLLHAVDGCVPYLTPSVLEAHFPPSEDLWIGMAVRDISVVPTYNKDNENNQPNPNASTTKLSTTSNSNKGTSKEGLVVVSSQPPKKKPRGYTFAAVACDSWLVPYTRVTVPSFDWIYDNDNHQKQRRQKQQQKQQQTNSSKVDGGSQTKTSSTNTQVLVWTPHGRQKLTPPLYAEASRGLNSQFTVSLYDMNDEEGNDETKNTKNNSSKRKEKAESRNKQWFRDLVLSRRNTESSSSKSDKDTIVVGSASSLLWSPILLPGAQEDIPEECLTTQQAHDDETAKDNSAGVALIGPWRDGLCKALEHLHTAAPPPRHVALLSTRSVSELLDIACLEGLVDIVGTDLPTRWAKDKLAFGIELQQVVVGVDHEANKRAKHEDSSEGGVVEVFDADGCIDLKDKRYARDSRPLVPGCSCLACSGDQFSRAYIHHLVCAKELLAEILLFGHNLHHLLSLIRSFNDTENSEKMKEFISAQLGGSRQTTSTELNK